MRDLPALQTLPLDVLLLPGGPLATLRASDIGVLVLLALFAWWGARRGALRQALSLSLIVGAILLAGVFAPRLESTIAKLSGLEPGERLAAAWATALFLTLVVGAIVLRFVGARLPPPERTRVNRYVGGALGLLKGGLVGVLVAYALLGASEGAGPPPLSRRDSAAPAEASSPLVQRMRGSLAAVGMARGAGLLTRWFEIPPWLRGQVEALNEQLDPGGDRRPRGR